MKVSIRSARVDKDPWSHVAYPLETNIREHFASWFVKDVVILEYRSRIEMI